MPVLPEVRRQLARYLTSELSLEEFTEWFVPVMAMAQEDGSAVEADLTSQIDLRLIEHANGDWSEAELKAWLARVLDQLPVPTP